MMAVLVCKVSIQILSKLNNLFINHLIRVHFHIPVIRSSIYKNRHHLRALITWYLCAVVKLGHSFATREAKVTEVAGEGGHVRDWLFQHLTGPLTHHVAGQSVQLCRLIIGNLLERGEIVTRSGSHPPENCHLTVKKLIKT